MSMDLQVLQFSLDKIHRARPARGASHVDAYIKAFYFNDADLANWVAQNADNYHYHHLDALLKVRKTKSAQTSQRKKTTESRFMPSMNRR